MPHISNTQGRLRQNLIDAGCSPELVQECLALAQGQQTAELRRLLARQRRALLDKVHQNEKRIDCLDYLVYQMEQEKKQN